MLKVIHATGPTFSMLVAQRRASKEFVLQNHFSDVPLLEKIHCHQ
jgi:hypothetical protein